MTRGPITMATVHLETPSSWSVNSSIINRTTTDLAGSYSSHSTGLMMITMMISGMVSYTPCLCTLKVVICKCI